MVLLHTLFFLAINTYTAVYFLFHQAVFQFYNTECIICSLLILDKASKAQSDSLL